MNAPRFTAPEPGNLYYNKKHDKDYSAGLDGYNPGIVGNYPYGADKKDRTGYPGLSCLPNCTPFATGWFNEIIGNNKCKYLGNAYGYNMIDLAKSQGLKTGTTPKPGAVMCWGGGNGHAACVVQVISKTAVYTIESGWNSKKVTWNQLRQKGNGNWGETNHNFQGFIYHPEIEFEFCPYIEPTDVIHKGAKGAAARWMQWHLNWQGYKLDVAGSFGPASEAALKDFQRKNGLPPTGWLDNITRGYLMVRLPWNFGGK